MSADERGHPYPTLLEVVEEHIGERVTRLHVLTATRSIFIEAPTGATLEIGEVAFPGKPATRAGTSAKGSRRARRPKKGPSGRF